MENTQSPRNDIFYKLQKMAGIGWWKADFLQNTFTVSEYIVNLLSLSNAILSFEDFIKNIHEDYRERVEHSFFILQQFEAYDEIFPYLTPQGYIWVHAKFGEKETDEKGHVFIWGYAQHMEQDKLESIRQENLNRQLNDLLSKHNSISHSLLAFLKNTDTRTVITKILKDILQQFHGDRAYIFSYDWEAQTHSCSYEVTLNKEYAEIGSLQNLPLSEACWWTKQLSQGSPIILNSLDDLPAHAIDEYEMLSRQRIVSLMVVPLISNNGTWGYVGIDLITRHKKWTKIDYEWFSSLANIISICVEFRKSEKEAEKERTYLKNLYQYMPIGYARIELVYDSKNSPIDFIYTDLNPAFETITHQSLSDFLHAKASERTDDTKVDLVTLANIPVGEHREIDRYVKQLDKYFHCTLYSPESGIVIALFNETTEMVKAHEQIRKSEEQLRKIYKEIPIGIEIYDKDGFALDINDTELEIFGLESKHAFIGLNIFDNPYLPKYLKEKLKKGGDITFDTQIDFDNIKEHYYSSHHKGVKYLNVKSAILHDNNGNIENYLIIIIDNTEAIKSYNKIKEFESFFSFISEVAEIGLYKWNPLKQTGFALPQWFKNIHEDEQDLKNIIGNYKHIHPEDIKKLSAFLQDAIAGKSTTLTDEIRVKEADGWKWVRYCVKVKEYDPANNNIEIVGVNVNISELKKTEAKLIEAKTKAEESDRLKSAFLANISHEIRTPLNAIVGFSGILTETDDPEDRQQYLDIIQKNNDLLLQLISDILDLSKIEAGVLDITYSDINAQSLCKEAILAQTMKVKPEVKLIFEDNQQTYHLYSDEFRLTQVLSNFITNAIKFTPGGFIRVGYHVYKDTIEFYVSDTGIGIPETQQERIFERFIKLNNFANGTGLGLSICKSIIKKLGGEIGVRSIPNQGSCFWFTLPLNIISVLSESKNP